MAELSASSLSRLQSHRQSSKFKLRLGNFTEFRAMCCDIDSEGIMGLTKWPVPFLVVPSEVCAGDVFSWSMVGSYAPGSDVASWSVDMGDGTVYDTESGTHSYGSAGAKVIQATVTADNGQSRIATAHMSVIDCEEPWPWPPTPGEPSGYLALFDDTNGFFWSQTMGAMWVARNTGLTNLAFTCGAVVRGWKDIGGVDDPEYVILVGGGIGFLAVTLNSGTLWSSIMPSDDNVTWVSGDPGVDWDAVEFVDIDCQNDTTPSFVVTANADVSGDMQAVIVLSTHDLGVSYTATYAAIGADVDTTDTFMVYLGTKDHGLYVSYDFTFGVGTPTWSILATGPTSVKMWGFGGSGNWPCCVDGAGAVWQMVCAGPACAMVMIATKAQIEAWCGWGAGQGDGPSGIYTDGDNVYVIMKGPFGDTYTRIVNVTAGTVYKVSENFNNYSAGNIRDCRTSSNAVHAGGENGEWLYTTSGPMGGWAEGQQVTQYTWTPTVYVDPNNPGVVYSSIVPAATSQGLARSSDYGEHFSTIDAVTGTPMHTMWIPKDAGDAMYWCSAFISRISYDGGSSWGNCAMGLVSAGSIWGDDNDGSRIAAAQSKNASDHIIWSTDDYGATVYNKAGPNPGTAPYTDSIPKDRVCVHQGLYITPMGGDVTAPPEAIGIAVDFETGSHIYVTYKDDSSNYYVNVYNTDLTLDHAYNLTTNHGVDGPVYPRCVWQPDVVDFGDMLYIYGQNSVGAFVAESLDAGVTLTDVSGALSALTSVAALAAKGDGAGQLSRFYAFLSDEYVYSADDLFSSWALEGSLPFIPHHRGMSISYDDFLTCLLGNIDNEVYMVGTSHLPYGLLWLDRTDGLSINSVKMIEWITPDSLSE